MLTKEQIKKYNYLIAKSKFSGLIECDFENSFKYHESLDSLLPIIEKIVDTGCIFEFVYNLNTYCRICVVNGKNNKAFNIEHQNETNVLSVEPIYLAIVEYIKYINSKEE